MSAMGVMVAAGLLLSTAHGGHAQSRPQAPSLRPWRAAADRSTFRIELGKAGWLRMLGDEHVIDVTEYDLHAQFDPANPTSAKLELVIPSRSLRVRDPHLSAEDRLQVQEKMEGREVLDVAHFSEIRFVARRITAGDDGLYRMHGELTIRGSARPAAFNLRLEKEGEAYRVRGEVVVKMTPYGIEPPSAGAGSVKVKDEMKIVFDLLLVLVKN